MTDGPLTPDRTELTEMDDGRWTVVTEGSVYEVDLDVRTVTRVPGWSEWTSGLRRDGTPVPLISLIECRVGEQAQLLIDVRSDGVQTLRITSPVVQIRACTMTGRQNRHPARKPWAHTGGQNCDRLLFLDVDGVTLPYKPVADGEMVRAVGFDLPYRPSVITAVSNLVSAGVRVMWLTTWPDEFMPELEDALGLPQLLVPARVEGTHRSPPRWQGWKTRTALATIEQLRPGRWAWADDDLHPATTRRIRQDHPESLIIAPNGDIGLTDDHLKAITDWLNSPPVECEIPGTGLPTDEERRTR